MMLWLLMRHELSESKVIAFYNKLYLRSLQIAAFHACLVSFHLIPGNHRPEGDHTLYLRNYHEKGIQRSWWICVGLGLCYYV